ncbi:hypothetical protein L226DRAFT_163462 [Lentinus tigrinus ALCF2SS1-7]|uniref:Pali-domain-containing protein n=1 Tax=Lentinus tigrinus ALCF2SS1-6 TaxID=1328759 RepID=A0A5C2S2S8_9APHY|nr:hypothetical protein L227DRAFT_577768 [Lentinus tigrinus ALCF2SS1-6]RPD71848.1 hypothetical protein L226DRAFT_163462 [Lentinus tigrinus ALCF2SS1-7]
MGCCIGRRHNSQDGTKRRRRPRPFARHLGISLTTCAFLFASFILFLLVGLSLPLIKNIYLFELEFATRPDQPVTSVATSLRFGVWGVCATSDLNTSECFTMLGYTIPEDILNLTGYPALVDDVADGVTAVLVLHLVAAGLAFVGVFSSLFLESNAMCILSLVTSIFTVLVGLVVFGIDLAVILVGKERVGPLTDFNYSANWGPALWLVLVGVVLSFIGMILMSVVVCRCCGVGRRHHRHHHRHAEEIVVEVKA